MNHTQRLLRSSSLVAILALVSCVREPVSNQERARVIWDKRIAAAERLVHNEPYWVSQEKLQGLEDFFYDLTGIGGIIVPHVAGVVTIDPHVGRTTRLLRQWCEVNCSRLTVDSDSGEVVVLEDPLSGP